MLLVVDIGNTNTVLGVFQEKKLIRSWRVRTLKDRTVDEYGILCKNLFALEGLNLSDIDDVVASCVVPPVEDRIVRLFRKYFGREVLFVDPAKQSVIPVLYNPPSDVGADRIVNGLAAFELVRGPAIVVDFGTATTFDAITGRGEYVGGVIAPGVRISADALFARAAKLPRIEIKEPSQVIGNCTVGAMQSGLFYGYVALVEGVLNRMKKEMGSASVIATGGLAPLIAHRAAGIDRIEEDLTLLGLRLFFERHRG
ncbi:MAG TPA: type III pantothenate kinase [Acidobacteriota bacterium]|nr:type III pantothenate kinase [Acidobacteriota bacterium]